MTELRVEKQCKRCKRTVMMQHFHEFCHRCFKEQMRERRGQAIAEASQAGYDAGYSDGWYAAWPKGREAGLEQARAATLAPELVREAILLTHPDRHPSERAEMANRVTKALLALRQNGVTQ